MGTLLGTLGLITPFGRCQLLSFQCLQRFVEKSIRNSSPWSSTNENPWNITVSRVFALSILSTSFPPYPWNFNTFKDFHFGVTFIRLSFCKPRQGIGPWSPMSNFSDFNALVFLVLSTLSIFCKKHYKSGLSEQLVRWCRLPPFFSENNDSDHPLKKHPSQGALPAIIMLFFTYLISTNLNL